MIQTKLNFDDATSLAAMRRLKIREVVSFDRHFDRAVGVVRLEPKNLVGQ